MTFLQLCKRLRQESGISGTGPTATTGNTGMLQKCVDWIVSAWLDIQNQRQDWAWMWSEATVNTVASTVDYAITSFTDIIASAVLTAGSVARWDMPTMKIYLQSDGHSYEGPLTYIPYQVWKKHYNAGVRDDARPGAFTILPNGTIRLDACDDVYVLTCDYYKSAVELSGDNDEPLCPDEYHNAIWATALVDYAAHDEAITIGQHAMGKARKIINQINGTQRPQIGIANKPLA